MNVKRRMIDSFGFVCLVVLLLPVARAQRSNIFEAISNNAYNPSTLLWYTSPAKKWVDALPVGNGRMGAMVFGRTDVERIQLNDDTYWSGGPYSQVRSGGYKYLHQLQRLVFHGRWLAAQKLFGRKFIGYPPAQQKYQPLGVLVLDFHRTSKVRNYKRWLNLRNGIVGTQFTAGGVTYSREVLASVPDQTIAIRITANKPGRISFTAQLRGFTSQIMGAYEDNIIRMDAVAPDELELRGRSASYGGVKGKVKFRAIVRVIPNGGQMKVASDTDTLIVKHANSVTLYFVDATNFVNYHDLGANPRQKVSRYLHAIKGKSFSQVKRSATEAYKSLFDRVELKLPVSNSSYLPTNERLKQAEERPDPNLSALAYQFGRYVLIASSQPGTQPANLQGIWNNSETPWWGSKYTTNINLEMNYWPVNSANLSELEQPLTNLMEGVSQKGSEVAKEEYGAEGWVLHQNTDIWRSAASMDGPTWGEFTTGGAWLMNELWKHYLYTMDKDYLRKIYPMMRGSVAFFMDFLVKEPNSKWYVTNPSTSPENFPARPGNGPYFDEVTGGIRPGTNICAGSAIDMQIIHRLFGNFIQASKILHENHDFAGKVARRRKLLLPPQIGKNGTLQEWAQDWGMLATGKARHSPAWGLFPGGEFSYLKTPKLMAAVMAALNQRGDLGGEFKRVWKVALWARLHRGNRALHILRGYYSESVHPQLFAGRKTVLQIDGTEGATAAITQLLLQSQNHRIVLLPALPRLWRRSGSFNGVMAEGDFEINMRWKAGQIVSAKVLSRHGGPCRINAHEPLKVKHNGELIDVTHHSDGSVAFNTKMGNVYIVTPE